MDDDLVQKAIALAVLGNWKGAIEANLEVLKENKDDADALNRLSKAYFECGNIKKAKEISAKVLQIDPINKIALRSVEKYKQAKGNLTPSDDHGIDSTVFIEEQGKTKLTNLINLGPEEICGCLNAGDEVYLSNRSHRITITGPNGTYLGKLPDDISSRLKVLIEGGNIYKAYVRSTEKRSLKILIREMSRSEKLKGVPSFPIEASESIGKNLPDFDY